jgi:hypothetical protein
MRERNKQRKGERNTYIQKRNTEREKHIKIYKESKHERD